MGVIMRQGSGGGGEITLPPAIMRSGAVEQFKKEKPVEIKENFLIKEKEETEIKEVSEIDFLRTKFEEQEGKEVPRNKKNDIDWIKSKLNT